MKSRFRYQDKHGYVFVKMPTHPNADWRGYVQEHRLVMSEHLGRPLERYECVSHKNGQNYDNRLSNLELGHHRARQPFVCFCDRKPNTNTYKGYEIKGFNYRKIFKLLLLLL